jgi:hypothetical protein
MMPRMDPMTQVKNGNCWRGIPLGVPPMVGGGPGCFPLAPGSIVVSSRVAVAVAVTVSPAARPSSERVK